MKFRLLFIFAVLLMIINSANAALTWVDASGTGISSVGVVAGDTVTVYLSSSDTVAYDPKWVGEDYVAGDAAVITGVTEVLNNAGDDGEVVDHTAVYPGWFDVSAADLSDPFDSIVAGKQWEVVISGLVLGSVDLSSDVYGTDDILTVNVTAVPEPVSIALLGLGGLLLRRRK
jgi:hypothetical protein